MAFISSSSFVGGAVIRSQFTQTSLTSKPVKQDANTPRMSFYKPLDGMLNKYDKLSKQTTSFPPSQPSSVWNKYLGYMLNENVLTNYVPESFDVQFEVYLYGIKSQARRHNPPGGSPLISKADKYMAECIQQQYKRTAVSTGVYNVTCTEGTVKHQADQSRVMSLGAAFRAKQMSTSAKYRLFFESRKQANAITHGCSYEENLYNKLPQSRLTAVRAYKESIGACSRSAIGESKAEDYMMRSVDRQCKEVSMSDGVYSVVCSDGTVKDMAEDKRVIGLAAKYRAGQSGMLAKLRRDFDRKKFARDMFAHECSYEEDLFNKYPSMAASMAGVGARY